MELTPHQAKYFALELSKHTASGDMHKLVPSLMDARVDSNPHQVQIIRKDIFFSMYKSVFSFSIDRRDYISYFTTPLNKF